jgi:uncharacterized protein (TIGR03435 family)
MNLPDIPNRVATLWAMIEPPLANHLWQSTLFAVVAGLLTLALKKNRAHVRYWLWLAASVKFIVPFSLLVDLGSRLRSSDVPATRVIILMQQIGQPFALTSSARTATFGAIQLLPAFLLAVWSIGFLAMLSFWWVRWHRMSAALHGSAILETEREFEMLCRVQKSSGVKIKIRLRASATAVEPGIVGFFRPVLLLPAGITERLTDAQLEAIFQHELCHVTRRDNLVAAVHMLVQAVFWFHPLLWWVGAKLISERERACDEEVLSQGSDPQVYAEGILKVCEFYLESPLVCVAGVTGSNLKRRIEEIMIHRITSKLNLAKKLLLSTAASATLVLPVVFGLLHPASVRAQTQFTSSTVFEDVSIKPAGVQAPGQVVSTRVLQQNGTVEAKNITIQHLIQFACGISPEQINGAPAWLSSDLYDLTIKTKADVSSNEFKHALQDVLAQQFKLAAHRELKIAPTFALVVGQSGPKLAPGSPSQLNRLTIEPVGHITATNTKIAELVRFLQNYTGHIVVDKTGLEGAYDFTLDAQGMAIGPAKDAADIAVLQRAVSAQLGLELNPQDSMVDMLVIDHAEAPKVFSFVPAPK